MNELYQISGMRFEAGQLTGHFHLNAGHPIFSGHFPGQPVLPGVCMMEMVCDLAARNQGQALRIGGAPLIKFLHMVDPRVVPVVDATLQITESGSGWNAEGKLFLDAQVFVRFQLYLTPLR